MQQQASSCMRGASDEVVARSLASKFVGFCLLFMPLHIYTDLAMLAQQLYFLASLLELRAS
jgi:hypothetical protein